MGPWAGSPRPGNVAASRGRTDRGAARRGGLSGSGGLAWPVPLPVPLSPEQSETPDLDLQLPIACCLQFSAPSFLLQFFLLLLLPPTNIYGISWKLMETALHPRIGYNAWYVRGMPVVCLCCSPWRSPWCSLWCRMRAALLQGPSFLLLQPRLQPRLRHLAAWPRASAPAPPSHGYLAAALAAAPAAAPAAAATTSRRRRRRRRPCRILWAIFPNRAPIYIPQ